MAVLPCHMPHLSWMVLLLGTSLLAAASSVAVDTRRHLLQTPLARDVGTPASHDWDDAIVWANDPLMTPLLTVLKDFKVPAATMAYLLNPGASVPHSGPNPGRSPQLWWAAGFGMPYNAPMRVASVSKPIVEAIYMQELASYASQPFFNLWTARVGALPEPLDPRVKQITIQQLLDHTSGFDNAQIGYDPAFQGKSVSQQIGTILTSTNLATDPGATFSYSNFGYMILARLAVGITRRSWLALNRRRFPAGAPLFEASDTTPAGAIAGVSAAEPSLYWVQAPDGPFKARFMAGNGNVVINAVSAAWFGTQYWIGGAGLAGKRISPRNFKSGYRWIFNGSMPGTLALLAQMTTQGGRVGSICIIIPTRMANSGSFLDQLNSAALAFMSAKFKDL